MTKDTKITKRQREVLDHLSLKGAFSRETAAPTALGIDHGVAETLATKGVINKRYDENGEVYWIRPENEPATGTSIPAGFVVILSGKDVTTPSGRKENFFLARALYDGKGTTMRRLLRGWLQTLKLKQKDVLSGSWGIELHIGDEPMFSGDHVIL